MNVLVTGGTGFIGSQLIPKLVESGHDVYSLERYVTGRYVLGRKHKVKTVFGDLRDHFVIRKIVREVQPEVVIHLAAISPVSYSYDHPMEVVDANFLGTMNLAESCLREVHHFKHFLCSGTSEEYGNQEIIPIKETAELRPNSPYSLSKVAADKYLQYMRDAYDFPMTLLRNFNTYGRKNNTHFIVERAIVQMLQQKLVELGDPKPVRDLEYVDDHVNSYMTCLNNDKAIGEVFNFCTGRGISIAQLVELIKELTGFEGKFIWNTIPSRPLDVDTLRGDNSKAKRLLGWAPRFTLEEGLQLTIDFWKKKFAENS
jgi:dTDP-glucose 4,6-dehydratase|tara:strand:+ start:6932 stop:7873 length:942 start_codon:yes stop_codon:yes gene_type:complete